MPDLIENFIGKAKSLLQDRNHGVLLSGVTLVIDMCNLDEECRDEFRKVRLRPSSPRPAGHSPSHELTPPSLPAPLATSPA